MSDTAQAKAASDRISSQQLMILGGAAVMLSLSMGMRQSFGLFQPGIIRDVGVTSADFSLAISIQNIIWGISQPFIGLLADRYGARWVSMGGVCVYLLGLVTMIFATGTLTLILGAGICIGLALSCTASSIAMSVTSKTVSPAKRSVAMGSVSAAGSLGLVLAAPLAQTLITHAGWQVALVAFLGLAAVMIPAAFSVGGADKYPAASSLGNDTSVTETVRAALGHSGYVIMALAFFVCGLQLVFITTHLPTYLALCGMDPGLGATTLALVGLFNVIGSYLFGYLGGIYPKQYLLGGVYLLRSLAVAVYFMTPPSVTSTLVFGAVMGTLWLGVVPLVNGLVAQLFGLRYMATLTGIAFFSHQVGSFLGAWGGGLIYDRLGSYDRAWQAAVLIGVIAGLAQMTMNVTPPAPKDAPGVPVPRAA
ncbi:major Facilitator Superfamily protein [Variibacter gotjawalensis]|uniref:Major Facilitator Superfamily protein n=1 Tax=Variibacter gotjawalensis TaxID=1333996 RepID=A0A0S3PSU4_9BRAD|nr:MFS transporter [Variibacter gotjawalensis]NIK49292.1 putative MFS family arabinose efflux permease [Variibacter gotjawalensis]RZS51143.1 putative MFS family arabinose efflux permease [Variibacter gotjawalensis]BAT58978.1 major Facilitator Superfamily protein [Variibacter gotjawalensis]